MDDILKKIEVAMWKSMLENEKRLWRETYGTEHPLSSAPKQKKAPKASPQSLN